MFDDDAPKTLVEETLFEGHRFSLTRLVQKLPGGDTAAREVIRHGGAAVVLPLLGDGRVVLVEQYRAALDAMILELPAGTIEGSEDPLAAAQRELEEETGYRAERWSKIISFFPAPGLTDETMHVFVAESVREGPARPDPGEWLKPRVFTLDEVRRKLLKGEIRDGKTIVALLYVMFLGLESSALDSGGPPP